MHHFIRTFTLQLQKLMMNWIGFDGIVDLAIWTKAQYHGHFLVNKNKLEEIVVSIFLFGKKILIKKNIDFIQ